MNRDVLALLVVGTALLAALLVGAALVATPVGVDQDASTDGPTQDDNAGPAVRTATGFSGGPGGPGTYPSNGSSGSYPTASTTAERTASTFSPVSTLM